jgi:hypothetical protein
MFYINDDIADKIYNKIKSIIELEDENWQCVDIINKIRYLHHTLNFFDNTKKKVNTNVNEIPLKSIKPRKLINLCGFNKRHQIFKDFLNEHHHFTFEYRENYTKKKIYYKIANLSKDESNKLLISYNLIIFNKLNNNINIINSNFLYDNLLYKNSDKIINLSDKITINLIYLEFGFYIIFNECLKILFTLIFSSDNITNNISLIYLVKLINNF